MMTKRASYLLAISIITLLTVLSIGCNSGSSNTSSQIAAVPNSACLDGQRGCIYSAQYTQTPYPRDLNGQYPGYYNGYSNGFCGCGMGYSVAYNSQFGLTCISNVQLTGGAYYMFYGWNSALFAFNSPQPRAYHAIPIQYQGSCRTDILHACLVEVSQSCGTNGYCRAIGGGALGICVYN